MRFRINIMYDDNLNDISGLTDTQLLERYATERNNEYLGVLYNRYTALIYGVCLRYLKNADDASDAVADIFEHLIDCISKYNIQEFRTWIYSVAKNHCLGALRKQKRSVDFESVERFMEFPEITHLLNEKNDEILFGMLKECMGGLPEQQRISIEMFFFEDKSYADIVAEKLYPLKNVKSYLQNGKRNLKNCIDKKLQKNND